MAEKPEQHVVGVILAEHHGFQIELHKRLAGEAGIIAKNPQLKAIRDKSPQMMGRPVQPFFVGGAVMARLSSSMKRLWSARSLAAKA